MPSSALLARSSTQAPSSLARRATLTTRLPLPRSISTPQQQQQQQRQHVLAQAGNNLYSSGASNTEALPPKVTLPPVQPEVPPPAFGFVDNAERINSRACMIGFFALIALEYFTNSGLLDMLGFNTGVGLGFEL
uniref:High light inducible protein n=1 Tax=Dunaliella tertiolecta TaxID=3047 RepID=A0A7S3R5M3_DUNTE|mmetsp:Transcript_13034/g.35482  ORF Transcript_13034/g.35482 Transcript_13034/m.35482 type:complete len:134 (+) Transcript_13034:81-482(+)|eukprot:103184-Pelagomonas_calceolata.AAC.3